LKPDLLISPIDETSELVEQEGHLNAGTHIAEPTEEANNTHLDQTLTLNGSTLKIQNMQVVL
jgi:hypothetical protein